MKFISKGFIAVFMFAMIFKINVINAQLIPLPPTLLNPLNGALNIQLTPDLKWNMIILIGELSSFRLQVSATENFSSTLIDSSGIISDSFKVPAGVLNPNTQYYWRVNASILRNFVLLTTPFSLPSGFRTLSAVGVMQTGTFAPGSFRLYENYPNPFNPVTVIKFDIAEASEVNVSVYDILGNKVDELVNANLSAGTYNADWNASSHSSGIYFCRITARGFTQTNRMILAR